MATLSPTQIAALTTIQATNQIGTDYGVGTAIPQKTVDALAYQGLVKATWVTDRYSRYMRKPVICQKDVVAEFGTDAYLVKITDKGVAALSDAMTREVAETGTCPACFNTHNLKHGRVVRHGWKESGGRKAGEYGNAWHTGQCFAVGYLPYEVSCDGTKEFLTKRIRPSLEMAEKSLHTLTTTDPDLRVSWADYDKPRVRGRTQESHGIFRKGEKHPGGPMYGSHTYEGEKEYRIRHKQGEVAMLTKWVADLNTKIADWVKVG